MTIAFAIVAWRALNERPKLKFSLHATPGKVATHEGRDYRLFSFKFGLTNDGKVQAVAPSFTVGVPGTWKSVMAIDGPHPSNMSQTLFENFPVVDNYRTVGVQLSADRPIHPGDTHDIILTTMYVPVGSHFVRWRSTCGDLVFPPGGDNGEYEFKVTDADLKAGRDSAARSKEVSQ